MILPIRLLLGCSNNVCISHRFFDIYTTTFTVYVTASAYRGLKSLSFLENSCVKDYRYFPIYTHNVVNMCHIR